MLFAQAFTFLLPEMVKNPVMKIILFIVHCSDVIAEKDGNGSPMKRSRLPEFSFEGNKSYMVF